jgi:hypothetical protein
LLLKALACLKVSKVLLPSFTFRFRGSREFQSFFATLPRKLMAYSLPVRPFHPVGPSGLRYLAPLPVSRSDKFALSYSFNATLAF